MKIKLLLTTLICFNIAATAYASAYANDVYIEHQPKLRRTIPQMINDQLDKLEDTYHIKEFSAIIAANVLMISITMRMQDQLTTPQEFKLVQATDTSLPGFEDLIGVDQAKEEAKDLLYYLKNKEECTARGIKPIKGCILHGPPGTGKTEFGRAMAKESGFPLIAIEGSSFNTMWRGSGTKQLKKLLKEAQTAAKKHGGCIVYIDEIDNLIGKPNAHGLESDTNSTTAYFKSMLDGFNKQNPLTPIFWMGSTNNPGLIDDGVTRDGRMPLIEVPAPSLEAVEKMFERKLGKLKADPSIDTKALAKEMYFPGYTGANIEAFLQKAAMAALKLGAKAINKAALVHVITHNPRVNERAVCPMPVNYNHGIGANIDIQNAALDLNALSPILASVPAKADALITSEVRLAKCGYCNA